MRYPAVPHGGGARAMLVLWACVALTGLIFAGVTFMGSAALAERVGLGSREDAVVTSKALKHKGPIGRGCREWTQFDLEWDTGTGYYTTCARNPEGEVGDRMQISVVPWSAQVSASRDVGWIVGGFTASLIMLFGGARSALRAYRLTQGGDGTPIRGTIRTQKEGLLIVTPEPGAEDQRRILMLPALRRIKGRVGEPVTIWNSRRSWRGTPRGPWVVKSRSGAISVATHLWRRK